MNSLDFEYAIDHGPDFMIEIINVVDSDLKYPIVRDTFKDS